MRLLLLQAVSDPRLRRYGRRGPPHRSAVAINRTRPADGAARQLLSPGLSQRRDRCAAVGRHYGRGLRLHAALDALATDLLGRGFP